MKTMKSIILPLALIYGALVSADAAAGEASHVDRARMEKVEKGMDATLSRFTTDNSHTLIGPTRGVYLPGVGAVFTAEVILVNAPVQLMHPLPTKEEIVMMRKKKLERIPLLKKILKDALVSIGAQLDAISPDEQVVIAVVLPSFTFEEATGVPSQITVQAPKQKLLDTKGAALDALIRVTEN